MAVKGMVVAMEGVARWYDMSLSGPATAGQYLLKDLTRCKGSLSAQCRLLVENKGVTDSKLKYNQNNCYLKTHWCVWMDLALKVIEMVRVAKRCHSSSHDSQCKHTNSHAHNNKLKTKTVDSSSLLPLLCSLWVIWMIS